MRLLSVLASGFALFSAVLPCASLAGGAPVSAEKKPSVVFAPLDLPSPSDDNERKSIRVSPGGEFVYKDGRRVPFTLSYRTLFKTNDMDKDQGVFGLMHDAKGEVLKDSEGRPVVKSSPDANSIFMRGGSYYLLTHLEGYPGSVYLTELAKEGGAFSPVRFEEVDFSGLGGTVFNCAGSKTPWDTHLGGEEDYDLDAIGFDPATEGFARPHIAGCVRGEVSSLCKAVAGMYAYLGSGRGQINPYDYGHIIEVSLDRKAKAVPSKRYAMGRGTFELAFSMPDKKTLYMTEDGTYSGFYMFVAKRPEDLSSGTLYMARWVQSQVSGEMKADIKWVRLGSTDEARIREIIKMRPLFTDIFDIADLSACPTGFKAIRAGTQGPLCVRLKDGKNGSVISKRFKNADEVRLVAASLETRRYGAYLGATAEFRKGEGMAFDPERRLIYVAISMIDGPMEANMKDPADDIRLPRNICGAVFAVTTGRAVDTDGRPIESGYAGLGMSQLVSGRPLSAGEKYSDSNACHPDQVANPDNLGFANGTLLIGEDSAFHMNNTLWAFDGQIKGLTRVMTIPTGGEITGSFGVLKEADETYIFTNIQHPFGMASYDATGAPANKAFIKDASAEQRRGHIGVIKWSLKHRQ